MTGSLERVDAFYDEAECVVCWNETRQRCSPCGDFVCHNCACPNDCQASLAGAEPARQREAQMRHAA